ncbi:MAG: hypothetical protein MJZ10_11915 [Fibrobacter sp.]|nr:hypothetical protein [Fibrobacter sp.]
MNLGTGYITTKGTELIAEILGDGEQIQWTKCTVTNQDIRAYTDAQLKELTTITETLNGTVETSISSETKSKIYVSCRFENEDVTEGFKCYGFGIWGKKAGGEETLIYVAPSTGADYTMNANSDGLTRLYVNAAIQVADASITGISISPSGGMATADALQDEIDARQSLEAVAVRVDTEQEITGSKTFTNGITVNAISAEDGEEIACTTLKPETDGAYSLGTENSQWNNVYCGRVRCQTIEPRANASHDLGTTGKMWNDIFCAGRVYTDWVIPNTSSGMLGASNVKYNNIYVESISGSIEALINAIASESQTQVKGNIGLFGTRVTETINAGSTIAGNALYSANLYSESGGIYFDTNETMTGTYRVMNTLFRQGTGTQISLVLAIKIAD